MAKKFGFFNSIQGDRKYLASDISQALDIGVTTGIKAEENNLKVVAYEGMQVQIQPGGAMIFGYFYINDEPEIITIDTADAELNRIDRIVLRYDAYTREVNTAVIKGSPALSPTPPAILRTNEQYDLVLADLYVPAAATEIGENNITDTRDDPDLCGYIGVKGAVSQLDFDAHQAESTAKHIKESGHNANGYYVRFDDGTQICRRDTTIDLSIEGFQSGGVFPAAFYTDDIRPAVAWNSYGSLGAGVAEILQKVFLGATVNEWRVYTDGSGTGTQTISLLAIGRWK